MSHRNPQEQASWALIDAYRLDEREGCIEAALAVPGITPADLRAIARRAIEAARLHRGVEFGDVRDRNKLNCKAAAAREAAKRLEARAS